MPRWEGGGVFLGCFLVFVSVSLAFVVVCPVASVFDVCVFWVVCWLKGLFLFSTIFTLVLTKLANGIKQGNDHGY